jgi:hypothetical protein
MVARDPENRPTASETLAVARHAFELDDVIEN